MAPSPGGYGRGQPQGGYMPPQHANPYGGYNGYQG